MSSEYRKVPEKYTSHLNERITNAITNSTVPMSFHKQKETRNKMRFGNNGNHIN